MSVVSTYKAVNHQLGPSSSRSYRSFVIAPHRLPIIIGITRGCWEGCTSAEILWYQTPYRSSFARNCYHIASHELRDSWSSSFLLLHHPPSLPPSLRGCLAHVPNLSKPMYLESVATNTKGRLLRITKRQYTPPDISRAFGLNNPGSPRSYR